MPPKKEPKIEPKIEPKSGFKKEATPSKFKLPRGSREHHVIKGRRQRAVYDYKDVRDELYRVTQRIHTIRGLEVSTIELRAELESLNQERIDLEKMKTRMANTLLHWDDLYIAGGGDNWQPPPPPPGGAAMQIG